MDFIQHISQDYINGLMLTGLIVVNIFLGSITGIINKQWDFNKFIKGVIKGASVAIATYSTYMLGGLNPDILIMTSDNVNINIQTAISLAITAGIVWYGKEVYTKIAGAISGKK